MLKSQLQNILDIPETQLKRELEKIVATFTGEEQYLSLVDKILTEGVEAPDRTGTGTLSIFHPKLTFDLTKGFPLLTTKRVYWKAVVEELLWFIKGSTNANELKCKIWDKDSSREALDARGLDYPEGELGPIYGYQWRNWGGDQLAKLIQGMRTNPYSRRHVLSAWNVEQIPQMSLPPCHMTCQFYIREGTISCAVRMRSGDMGLGVPFNIASYALLTNMMGHILNLTPKTLSIDIVDCHIYKDHMEALKTQLEREPRPFPKLHILPTNTIDEFTEKSFKLVGYKPHKKLKMKLSY